VRAEKAESVRSTCSCSTAEGVYPVTNGEYECTVSLLLTAEKLSEDIPGMHLDAAICLETINPTEHL